MLARIAEGNEKSRIACLCSNLPKVSMEDAHRMLACPCVCCLKLSPDRFFCLFRDAVCVCVIALAFRALPIHFRRRFIPLCYVVLEICDLSTHNVV